MEVLSSSTAWSGSTTEYDRENLGTEGLNASIDVSVESVRPLDEKAEDIPDTRLIGPAED